MVRTVKIIRIHLTPRSRTRVLVHLEDLDPLEIALDVMNRSGVHVGSELEPADLAHLREDDTKWRVRQVALHLLSSRPRVEWAALERAADLCAFLAGSGVRVLVAHLLQRVVDSLGQVSLLA